MAFARPNGVVMKLLVVKGCEAQLERHLKFTSDEYKQELLAAITVADSPTYIHPPRGAVLTKNPGEFTGRWADRAARAKSRWR